MTYETDCSRRAVLAAGAGGAATVLLAACSSSASTATTAPSSSAGPSSSDSPSAPAGGGTKIAALADVPVGRSVSVELPDGPGLVTRTSASDVVCFSAICTHQGCTVAPNGAIFECPCHHSKFNLKTGDVLEGQAPAPLAKVEVKVVGGEIVTA